MVVLRVFVLVGWAGAMAVSLSVRARRSARSASRAASARSARAMAASARDRAASICAWQAAWTDVISRAACSRAAVSALSLAWRTPARSAARDRRSRASVSAFSARASAASRLASAASAASHAASAASAASAACAAAAALLPRLVGGLPRPRPASLRSARVRLRRRGPMRQRPTGTPRTASAPAGRRWPPFR